MLDFISEFIRVVFCSYSLGQITLAEFLWFHGHELEPYYSIAFRVALGLFLLFDLCITVYGAMYSLLYKPQWIVKHAHVKEESLEEFRQAAMKLFKAEYVDPIELQARLQRYMAGTVALFVLGLAVVLFWYFFKVYDPLGCIPNIPHTKPS